MKIVYSRDQKIKGSLTGDFDKDYAFLEAVFERSGDIVKNPFCIADFCRAAAIYVDGMTDADMVEDFVIRPLLKQKWEEKISGRELLSYIENHVMETVDWKEDETFENILTDILSGNTLLLLEGCKKAIILSTKKVSIKRCRGNAAGDGDPGTER